MKKKTLKEIYSIWKETKKMQVKPASYATYVVLAECHVIPDLGHLYDIPEDRVQQFVATLHDSGLSRSTIRQVVQVLRMIVRYGYKRGWTEYTHWDVSYMVGNDIKSLAMLSVNDQRRIFNYVRQHPSIKNIGICISMLTGMRIGEVCGLKWSDIDIGNRLIYVQRTVQRLYSPYDSQGRSKVVVGRPKTRKSLRVIPISDLLVDMLLPFRPCTNGGNYLLTNSPKPTEPYTYRQYYYRLIKRNHLPCVKFHGLRHSFATRCVESGCDYKTVSSILGHADIGTTMNLYVHPDINQKKKCIEKLMKTIG